MQLNPLDNELLKTCFTKGNPLWYRYDSYQSIAVILVYHPTVVRTITPLTDLKMTLQTRLHNDSNK